MFYFSPLFESHFKYFHSSLLWSKVLKKSCCAVCCLLIHFNPTENGILDTWNPSSLKPSGFSLSSATPERTTAIPEHVSLSHLHQESGLDKRVLIKQGSEDVVNHYQEIIKISVVFSTEGWTNHCMWVTRGVGRSFLFIYFFLGGTYWTDTCFRIIKVSIHI